MAQEHEHEQVVRQQEQIDRYECLWCGGTFDSGEELRNHTCTVNFMDNSEPTKQAVQFSGRITSQVQRASRKEGL